MKQLQHNEITNIKTTFPIVIICDNFHSPENVGMAFRVCETMGVQHLYLTKNSPTPPNRRIKKTARTAEKSVPFSIKDTTLSIIRTLKAEGYTLIGLEITDESKNLHGYLFTQHTNIALVLGAENFGISEEVLAELDACLHIPMFGNISSMNVIMAMSISLYEITKQLIIGNK